VPCSGIHSRSLLARFQPGAVPKQQHALRAACCRTRQQPLVSVVTAAMPAMCVAGCCHRC
jgi:hypothetical protein